MRLLGRFMVWLGVAMIGGGIWLQWFAFLVKERLSRGR